MGRRTTIKISVLSSINTQVRVLKKSTYFFHSDKVKIGSHYKFTHAVLICEFMNHLLSPMFVLSETQLSEKSGKRNHKVNQVFLACYVLYFLWFSHL